MGTQGENKHVNLNVLYMADICAKFEKNYDCTSFSFKGSYLN